LNKKENNRILFITLRVFSAMGGIEKVCRVMGKALWEYPDKDHNKFAVYSMYDAKPDIQNEQYFPATAFRGFAQSTIRFMLAAIKKGMGSNIVLLSHINLLPAGWIIKKLRPKTKLVLLAHGIEIWGTLTPRKKNMLASLNEIWAVSEFTRQRIIAEQGFPSAKVKVLNNCLDPYLPAPAVKKKSPDLLATYGFASTDIVMLLLSRIAATERHKNYDTVIAAMDPAMKATGKTIRYLIAGKYTLDEEAHIWEQAEKNGVEAHVRIAGYIPDEELADHFALADMYVMPSSKEGFGIVFIEAMYYGLPVIAGNADGSADALRNGEMGTMVTPGNVEETTAAIIRLVDNPASHIPDPIKLNACFGYKKYACNITQLLNTISAA
jgi:phosphatidyl-myo-inositol dimannoside synthase